MNRARLATRLGPLLVLERAPVARAPDEQWTEAWPTRPGRLLWTAPTGERAVLPTAPAEPDESPVGAKAMGMVLPDDRLRLIRLAAALGRTAARLPVLVANNGLARQYGDRQG